MAEQRAEWAARDAALAALPWPPRAGRRAMGFVDAIVEGLFSSALWGVILIVVIGGALQWAGCNPQLRGDQGFRGYDAVEPSSEADYK